MTTDGMYHEGMRRLQDRRDTRRPADRPEQVAAEGRPDCKKLPAFSDALPERDRG